MMKKFIIIVFALFFISNISSAQFFNKFSIFGGPMIGWQIPQVTGLNDEMDRIGIPKFSSGDFLTLGGGGYIDIPVVHGLRIGAFGTGFTKDKISTPLAPTDPILTAKFSLHYAAISVEYVDKLSKNLEFTVGGNIGVGSTKLYISRFKQGASEWDASSDSLLTNYSTSRFSTTTFTLSPQIGLGFNATKYLYLKLNAGYVFILHDDWKLEDVLVVKNVPAGIKADGFNFNLGINFGLFTD